MAFMNCLTELLRLSLSLTTARKGPAYKTFRVADLFSVSLFQSQVKAT